MKSIIKCLLLMVTIFGQPVLAQNSFRILSGVLSENLNAGIPYLVVGDVFVSPGSTVTIEAGTVVMFQEFTGLHVQGTLFVRGSSDNPVIFTSKNDKLYDSTSAVDPAPYDWNGIDIYDGAIGTSFSDCTIRYSVYGIRAQTEFFKITNAQFNNNGKADVTINGEKQNISVDVPFSYGAVLKPEANNTLSVPLQLDSIKTTSTLDESKPLVVAVTDPTDSKNKSQHKTSTAVHIIRYTGFSVGIGAGAAAFWYYKNKFIPAKQFLDDLSKPSMENLRRYSSKDFDNALTDRNRKLGLCLAGAGGALLGLSCFVITFAF